MQERYESIEHASAVVVKALGGNKAVGEMLFPALTPVKAQERVAACLKENRGEKLTYAQIRFLAKKGCEIGCHAIHVYEAESDGYIPSVPIKEVGEDAIEILDAYCEVNKRTRNAQLIHLLKGWLEYQTSLFKRMSGTKRMTGLLPAGRRNQ